MQTFAPDLGADIKRFTGSFDTAEQALADLRGLGEQILPWNLIPTINGVLPEFLSLELSSRPIFDAYFCVADSGDKQIRLDTSARYSNASADLINYKVGAMSSSVPSTRSGCRMGTSVYSRKRVSRSRLSSCSAEMRPVATNIC
jgi:hypothetical protein